VHTILIHQAFVSPAEAGGTRHVELARPMVAGGDEFTIVAADVSYLTGRVSESPSSEERVDGVRVLRAKTLKAIHRSFLWRVVSFLSFMVTSVKTALGAGRVDLVMGTTPPIFQAVSAWVVSVFRRRPFLLEVRDLWPDFAIALGVLRNRALIWIARRLEAFLYARADHVLVNSPAYRDYLLRRGIPAAKVTLIPNGVDTSAFRPGLDGAWFRKPLGLEQAFTVVYAGALGMANDIDTLLDAAALVRDLPEVRVVLVGDGKDRPRLELRAESAGLTNVVFAGTRPKHEMPAVLAGSDACVAILKDIPEFRTTYPNKVFDYMAAGKPTILAIGGVIQEVIEAAGGGIITPPGNAAALAEAIRVLRADPGRARAMGTAARAYVEAHFDRRDHARRFSELLHRLGGGD
jgi:glycosyltransferase involved in cell wall biosynthesis